VIGIWSTTARQPRPATFVRSSVAPAIANGLREPVAVANRLGAGARFGALIGSVAGACVGPEGEDGFRGDRSLRRAVAFAGSWSTSDQLTPTRSWRC
jgi:hypothetical protein